jgi:hypothetical protein
VSEHTPGPWHIWVSDEGAFVLSSNAGDYSMVIAKRDVGTPNPAEGIANALLIAAAPELLEALKHAVALYDRSMSPLEFAGTFDVNSARRAIAKAEE